LFVPQNDPLIFYKKIKAFAQNHLTGKGKIFLEVHEALAKQTAEIFSGPAYRVEVKKDMSGKERILIIDRCP
jgi:release factor glutamine methyltransferase